MRGLISQSERLAKFLTNYENHRTQTEYETSLLCKARTGLPNSGRESSFSVREMCYEGMMLKFVNSFFALYYVAFFKELEAHSMDRKKVSM